MRRKKTKNGIVSLLINVFIPFIIMVRYSTVDTLGPTRGLIIALSFPLLYGIYDYVSNKNKNFFSILGIIGVVMLAIIGLFQLNPFWVAIKEAIIPFGLGVLILISQKSKSPIVKIILQEMIDFGKIEEAYNKNNKSKEFEKQIKKTGNYIALSFFFSAVLNYALAIYIVQSPPGTEEFTREIGTMTALSFPVIVVPIFIVLLIILFQLFAHIKKHTGLEMEDIIHS